MSKSVDELSQDLLRGADEIAAFLFGSKAERRKTYHLIASSRFPHFKLGSMVCARKSTIIAWIEAQELKHANDNAKPDVRVVRIGNGRE